MVGKGNGNGTDNRCQSLVDVVESIHDFYASSISYHINQIRGLTIAPHYGHASHCAQPGALTGAMFRFP